MAGFVAYVLTLPYLGFLPATLAFMIIGTIALGGRARLGTISIAAVIAIATHLVFVTIFQVPLPSGKIGQVFGF